MFACEGNLWLCFTSCHWSLQGLALYLLYYWVRSAIYIFFFIRAMKLHHMQQRWDCKPQLQQHLTAPQGAKSKCTSHSKRWFLKQIQNTCFSTVILSFLTLNILMMYLSYAFPLVVSQLHFAIWRTEEYCFQLCTFYPRVDQNMKHGCSYLCFL